MIIAKVRENKQKVKMVTIPKNTPIIKGDYVKIVKIEEKRDDGIQNNSGFKGEDTSQV